jgi:hypothetical protein
LLAGKKAMSTPNTALIINTIETDSGSSETSSSNLWDDSSIFVIYCSKRCGNYKV